MYYAASATVVGNPTFVIVLPIWYCGRIRNKVAVFLNEALRLQVSLNCAVLHEALAHRRKTTMNNRPSRLRERAVMTNF